MTETARPLSAPQKALKKLGLMRPIDLALHLPLRYEDETQLVRLADARAGEVAQIEGQVIHQEVLFRPRRQLLVTLDDGSARCVLRFFSFYSSQLKQMAVGVRLRVRGELRGGFAGWTMMHPVVRSAGGALAKALTSVYPSVAGLSQTYLRKAVHSGLAQADLSETVPRALMQSVALLAQWNLRRALYFLHQPAPDTSLTQLDDHTHPAWLRLKAEELLAQQLSQLQARRVRQRLRAPVLRSQPGGVGDQLQTTLPFQLTPAQQRVLHELKGDLAREQPMHRLLQGDVGSGKTVVAALAAAVAIDAGWQCALMAPTEILAQQHFGKLVEWLSPLLTPRGQQVAWLTGSQRKKSRDEMLAMIESGQAAVVVGTQTVIQAHVQFHRLGLAIIDEQHRFGVQQRLDLRNKLSKEAQEAHMLMMSATPIPRTLAMTYYADLDVSTVDELPPGRTPVVTKLISAHRREEVIARIRVQIEQGRQVYWVCPLIEESEALDLRNATETHAHLCEALPGHLIGLLHSRMPAAEKKSVMQRFVAGDMPVLVSTTVIEVGVDVPNASLMVIEHAERFGLSQLHQLRGRVGRGGAASACVLMYAPPEGGRLSDAARARLKAMVETSDGFEIARRDLEIRGPGEFLGSRQSGAALLRFADLTEDEALLKWARAVAPKMLDDYPALAARHIDRWLGGRMDYLKA